MNKTRNIILAIILIAVALIIWEARTALRPKVTKGHIDRKTGKSTIDTIEYGTK